MDLGVGPRGNVSPFLIDRFGSGYIAHSSPFVGAFSYPSYGLKTSVTLTEVTIDM